VNIKNIITIKKTAEGKTSCVFDGENENMSLLLICEMDDILFGNARH